MSYHDIDYDDDVEEESETTLQSAREELEYWTEFFQEQKDENLKNGCSTETLFLTHLFMPFGY